LNPFSDFSLTLRLFANDTKSNGFAFRPQRGSTSLLRPSRRKMICFRDPRMWPDHLAVCRHLVLLARISHEGFAL
jgi:hypothetical protein